VPYAPLAPGTVLVEGGRYLFLARWQGKTARPAVGDVEEKLDDAGFDVPGLRAVGEGAVGGLIEPKEAGRVVRDVLDAVGALGATAAGVITGSADGDDDDDDGETALWWKRVAAGLAIPGVILKVDPEPGPLSDADRRAWLLTWGPLLLGLLSLGVGLYMAFGRGK